MFATYILSKVQIFALGSGNLQHESAIANFCTWVPLFKLLDCLTKKMNILLQARAVEI